MADTTIRKLLVRLGVEADTATLAKFDTGLSKIATGARDLVLAGTAAAATLVGITTTAADAGNAAEKGAQKTATQVEAYQELVIAGDRAGLTVEQVEQGLIKQAAAMRQVTEAAGPAYEAYSQLGISAGQLAGLSPDEALMLTAEALAGVADETRRAQLAAQIYGEELGARMLPLLNQGSAGIAALRQEARDMGLIISEEAAAASAEFGDRLADVIDIAKGLRNAFGLVLVPELSRLLTRFRDWFVLNREIIQQKLEEYAEKIASGLERAEEVITKVVDRMGGWENVLKLVTAGITALVAAWAAFKIGTVIAGIVQVVSAISAMGGAIGPVLIAFGALLPILQVWGAFALIIDDLLTYFRGGDSVIGRFIDRFREGEGFVGAFARALESALGFAQEAFPVVSGLFGQVLGIFQQLYQLAQPLIDLLATGFGMVIEGYLMPFTLALEGIGLLFDALIPKVSQFGALASSVLSGVSGLLGGGADTSGLAPSTPESTVGGGGGSTSNSTTTVNNYNGLNTSDIEALNAAAEERAARSASEAGTAGVV